MARLVLRKLLLPPGNVSNQQVDEGAQPAADDRRDGCTSTGRRRRVQVTTWTRAVARCRPPKVSARARAGALSRVAHHGSVDNRMIERGATLNLRSPSTDQTQAAPPGSVEEDRRQLVGLRGDSGPVRATTEGVATSCMRSGQNDVARIVVSGEFDANGGVDPLGEQVSKCDPRDDLELSLRIGRVVAARDVEKEVAKQRGRRGAGGPSARPPPSTRSACRHPPTRNRGGRCSTDRFPRP